MVKKITRPVYVSQEGVGLGWNPDLPDHRDYVFADRSAKHMKSLGKLLASPRLLPDSKLLGPRRDQHAEGSCTGHGTASAANRITRQDGDRFNTTYSPRFLYNMARILEGCARGADGSPLKAADGSFLDPGPWIKEDNGAYVRDAVLALRQYGAPPESNWKYRASIQPGDTSLGWDDFRKVPTKSRFGAAHRFRVEAQRCSTLEEILSALDAGFPVVFGFMCHTGMWTSTVDRTGVMPMPTSRNQEDGGHCVCAHWYDPNFPVSGATPGVLFFENSWSEGWAPQSPTGIAGVGALPFEFVGREWADDFWAVVKEAS